MDLANIVSLIRQLQEQGHEGGMILIAPIKAHHSFNKCLPNVNHKVLMMQKFTRHYFFSQGVHSNVGRHTVNT